MISIIIPLYNKEKEIGRTLLSVLSQTMSDYEVIVVNDGSTDGGVAIVQQFSDNRIRLITQENGGPSKARNSGMDKASGEWLLILDADDELEPDALKTFDYLIKKYPNERCFACNFYMSSNSVKKIYSPFYSEKIIKHPIWAWDFHMLCPRAGAALFHKSVTTAYHFDNNLHRYEDAEWLFRIMHNYSFVRYPVPILSYNLDSVEASGRRKDIKEDYLGHLNFTENSIGEKLANYQLYCQARRLYPEECSTIYYELSWQDKIILCCLFYITNIYSKFLRLYTKLFCK